MKTFRAIALFALTVVLPGPVTLAADSGGLTMNQLNASFPSTNFVVIRSSGRDSTSALNSPLKPSATITNALRLLAASPSALTNGAIVITPGTVLRVQGDGILARNQSVTVFAAGATINNTNYSTFAITNAGTTLRMIGGTWNDSISPLTRIVAMGGYPTNAVVSVENCNGSAIFDWLHVYQGDAPHVPVTVSMDNCHITSGNDIVFMNLSDDATNSVFNLRNCHFISDGSADGTAGISRGVAIYGGTWTIDSSTFTAINGSQQHTAVDMSRGVVKWVNSGIFSSDTNAALGGISPMLIGSGVRVDFYNAPCNDDQISANSSAIVNYNYRRPRSATFDTLDLVTTNLFIEKREINNPPTWKEYASKSLWRSAFQNNFKSNIVDFSLLAVGTNTSVTISNAGSGMSSTFWASRGILITNNLGSNVITTVVTNDLLVVSNLNTYAVDVSFLILTSNYIPSGVEQKIYRHDIRTNAATSNNSYQYYISKTNRFGTLGGSSAKGLWNAAITSWDAYEASPTNRLLWIINK